ncbi:MAG: hypothetical protein Q9170_005041 [Blastenia crenularia]
MDPRYPYSGYASHPHDAHAHLGHSVEFQNIEPGERSSKKRRGNLPKQVTDILRAWLHDHLDHAYPNEEQKQQLIRETGLNAASIYNDTNKISGRRLLIKKQHAGSSEPKLPPE